MSNHVRIRDNQRNWTSMGARKKRPKTFVSVDAANTYADKNKIIKYYLKNLRLNPDSEPKYKIVVQK